MEGQVVQARSPLLEVLGNGTVRGGRDQQLHLGFSRPKEGGQHRLSGDLFPFVGGTAQDLAEDALRLLQVGDRNADVFESLHAVSDWGNRSAASSRACRSTSLPSQTVSMSGRSITSSMMPSWMRPSSRASA